MGYPLSSCKAMFVVALLNSSNILEVKFMRHSRGFLKLVKDAKSRVKQWGFREVKRRMDAHNHPDFYRQLGQVPEQIVADALAALQARFNL